MSSIILPQPHTPVLLRVNSYPQTLQSFYFLTNPPNRKGTRFSQGGQNFVDPALLTPSTERSDIGLDYGRAGREPLGVASSSAVLPGAGIYPHFGDFVVMSRDFCGDFRSVSFILDLSKLHGTKQ